MTRTSMWEILIGSERRNKRMAEERCDGGKGGAQPT